MIHLKTHVKTFFIALNMNILFKTFIQTLVDNIIVYKKIKKILEYNDSLIGEIKMVVVIREHKRYCRGNIPLCNIQ